MDLQWKPNLFGFLNEMARRFATNERDRVAGLAYLLRDTRSQDLDVQLGLPLYSLEESADEAWLTYASAYMDLRWRADLIFLFPAASEGKDTDAWLPTWTQLMRPGSNHYLHHSLTEEHGLSKTLVPGNKMSYTGPVLRNCEIRTVTYNYKYTTDGVNHRKVSVSHQSDPTYNMTAYHRHQIPDGTYDLLGSKCRKYWVVGKVESDTELERWDSRMQLFRKISVLAVPPPDSTSNNLFSSLCETPEVKVVLL